MNSQDIKKTTTGIISYFAKKKMKCSNVNKDYCVPPLILFIAK